MTDAASLASELRAEGLATDSALEQAVIRIAEAPNDPAVVRHRELLQRTGDAVARMLASGKTVDRIAHDLGVITDSVTFIRGLCELWRVADETGIGWFELACATVEKFNLRADAQKAS